MSDAQATVVSKRSGITEERKAFFYLLISIAAAAATYLLPVAMTENGRRTLSVTIFMIAMFITEPVPFAVTGLLGCSMYWAWAHIPPDKAFSGFHNDTAWFILGCLLLGVMADASGLAKRIAYNLVSRLSSNYASILAGLVVLNFLLSFVIPSGMAKTLVLCTISIGLIQSYGLAKNSNIGRGLILIMTYESALIAKAVLLDPPVILARGYIESIGKMKVSFGLWMIAYMPITILTLVACWWLTLKLFPPEKKTLEGGQEYCRSELRRMGPMSAREFRACIILLVTTVLWATDYWHHISASLIGLVAGLFACLPEVGAIKKEDFVKVNFPIVIFIGAAISLGNVMAQTDVLKILTAALFKWMTPALHSASWSAGLLLYWYANIFHIFLANEPSMISATMPALMQFAVANGLNPLALGMLWGFASGGKVFIYQAATLSVGYAFGYFTTKDLFKLGLAMFVVESILIFAIVPWYWPLLGLSFR